MHTKERLARALREADAPDSMIKRALKGYYDDFESHLDDPHLQLLKDCNFLGLHSLASQVIDGDFHGTDEEMEAWLQKAGVA